MIREFARDLGALDEIFAFLAEFASHEGLGEQAGLRLDLVAEELFTNIVRHGVGGDGRVQIGVERTGPALRLELVDFGVQPFDPATVEPAVLGDRIEDRRAGGLGLHLVRSLVDQLEYEYRGRDMRVRVTTHVGS